MHTTPSLKERQRQERETLILEVAEEAFAEKGYHETSIDEIAAQVGVAKGTVYLHFPSKEALIVAILLRDMHRSLEEIDSIIASDASTRTKLQTLIKSMYMRFRCRYNEFLSPTSQIVEMRSLFSKHSAHLQELRSGMLSKICTIIDQGKNTGEIETKVPTAAIVMTLLALVSSHISMQSLLEANISPEEFMNYMETIFFEGITQKNCDLP